MNQFINDASGSYLRVGTGLESQTYAVEFSKQFSLEKSQVTLIDTPGFDDTTKSDAEVLKAIAEFLARIPIQAQAEPEIAWRHLPPSNHGQSDGWNRPPQLQNVQGTLRNQSPGELRHSVEHVERG